MNFHHFENKFGINKYLVLLLHYDSVKNTLSKYLKRQINLIKTNYSFNNV